MISILILSERFQELHVKIVTFIETHEFKT